MKRFEEGVLFLGRALGHMEPGLVQALAAVVTGASNFLEGGAAEPVELQSKVVPVCITAEQHIRFLASSNVTSNGMHSVA